jgi:heme/copper-type cytochrome/quinol oxidase subunit 2
MLLFKRLYLELVSYVLILCFFIPLWVFFILGWQVFRGQETTRLSRERNIMEFGWTAAPTLMVSVLCVLNLQCLASDSVVQVQSIIKVVGRQWY